MNILHKLSQHKFKFLITLLLAAASTISVLLVVARWVYTDTHDFSTLIWNLFLAWIPYMFALVAYTVSWSRKLLYFVVPVCAVIWLIFFPNAPYMLTEFQHLSANTANAPLWFDVLMLIWFALTGLVLGVVSLYLMQEIVARAFNPTIGWFFALFIAVLSSVGIYLGRFLRWNSWDILQDPTPIAKDIWGWFDRPTSNLRAYGFTLLFTLLFLFVYLAFHTFGKVMQERNPKQIKPEANERGNVQK